MTEIFDTIKGELSELLNTTQHSLRDREGKIKKTLYDKTCKRIRFLNLCITYLESQPSAVFLKKEEGRIKKRLELIENGFKDWSEVYKGVKNARKEFEKLNGVKQLREQLKAIKFISQ